MRPTTVHAFPYDVIAAFGAIVAGIIVMAIAPSDTVEWMGKTLFAGGIISAFAIAFIDAARQHLPAPNTEDQHG